MRNDSHGNLFNFNQPPSSQDPAAAENPMDKLWTGQDDHLGDLGNLDDIDVQPIGEANNGGPQLPADILEDTNSSSTTSTTTGEKTTQQQAPSTPNGDRIDSSIASVVEMVSKSNNTQPTMTSVSQAMPTTGTGFAPQNSFPNQSFGTLNQPVQGDQNARVVHPMKAAQVKVENGTTQHANGHREQVPNGARIPEDDEQIGQYVKLIVADEQRRKAADAGSKAKPARKSRSKKAEVKEEMPREEDDFFDRSRTMVHAAAHNFQQQLARTQLIKQQGPSKQ